MATPVNPARNSQRTKKQHFVPRFYLSNFIDINGMVWTYDKATGRISSAIPLETAVETNFYSVQLETGEYNDDIENLLSEIESAVAPRYPDLVSGRIPSGTDRQDFSDFFATLMTRSPAYLNAAAVLFGDVSQITSSIGLRDRQYFDDVMDKSDAANGSATEDIVRDKAFDLLTQHRDKLIMNVDKKVGLQQLGTADTIADIMFRMSWHVLEVHDNFFITSDNPVVRVTPSQFHHPVYGDGGFSHKHCFVTIPLSTSRMLEMNWQVPEKSGRVSPINRQRSKPLNRMRAVFAEKYIYSDRSDAGISALARKHQEPGLRMNVEHPSKRAPVIPVRKLGPSVREVTRSMIS